MVSHEKVAAAFNAAAEALGVDGDELGDLLAVLASSSEKVLAFFPIGANNKAIIKFVRSLQSKDAAAESGSGTSIAGSMAELFKIVQVNQQATQRLLANQEAHVKYLKFVSRIIVTDLKRSFRPPSSGKESRGSNKKFRDRVAKSYGMGPMSLRCLVLNKALPNEFLVAGHLFAVRWEEYACAIMGGDFDIKSSQNGIIWCSAIEHEYELQRICFSKGIREQANLQVTELPKGEFILHVLDKTLLPVKLSSVGQHKNKAAFAAALGDVTFGDLHNKHVNFLNADGGPYKSALALHAKVALEHCAKTYPDDFNPETYNFDDRSEHDGKEEFVNVWLSQLDTESVAEVGVDEEAEESVLSEESVDLEEVDV